MAHSVYILTANCISYVITVLYIINYLSQFLFCAAIVKTKKTILLPNQLGSMCCFSNSGKLLSQLIFTRDLRFDLTDCSRMYRNEAESQRTCRGTIPVADAAVQEHGVKSFVVSCNRRAYYLRALSASDRDRWVRALRVEIGQAKTSKTCSAFKHINSFLSTGRGVDTVQASEQMFR